MTTQTMNNFETLDLEALACLLYTSDAADD